MSKIPCSGQAELKNQECGKELNPDMEITQEMIDLGLQALHRSGIVETPLESDRFVVEEIFQSMVLVYRS